MKIRAQSAKQLGRNRVLSKNVKKIQSGNAGFDPRNSTEFSLKMLNIFVWSAKLKSGKLDTKISDFNPLALLRKETRTDGRQAADDSHTAATRQTDGTSTGILNYT